MRVGAVSTRKRAETRISACPPSRNARSGTFSAGRIMFFRTIFVEKAPLWRAGARPVMLMLVLCCCWARCGLWCQCCWWLVVLLLLVVLVVVPVPNAGGDVGAGVVLLLGVLWLVVVLLVFGGGVGGGPWS